MLPDQDAALPVSQVMPVAGQTKEIELWAVAEGAGLAASTGNGITVTAVVSANANPQPLSLAMSAADAARADAALAAAGRAGLLTESEVSRLRASLALGTGSAFRGVIHLHSTAAPGRYNIQVTALDGSGVALQPTATAFDHLSLAAFETDFSLIDFGIVSPGGQSRVAGDEKFVMNDGHPSIRNIGNVPLRLEIIFKPMVSTQGSTQILNLGAGFLGERRYFQPGKPLLFSNWIMPGQVAGVDTWLDPPVGIPPAKYSGTVSVSMWPKSGSE